MPKVVCPNQNCQRPYAVPDSTMGKKVRCKQCGTTFRANSASTVKSGRSLESTSKLAIVSPPLPSHIGRFEVLAELGRGAFGTVYHARDPKLDRDVAIKVPQSALLEDPQFVERFLREGRAAARLNHPHIVPIFETSEGTQQTFIAAAYIQGQALSSAIGELAGDYRHVAEIVRKLATALHFAHRHGIIHRDVKPHNVLLDNQGEPHLTDFGLARLEDAAVKLTVDGELMGTPAYMSPEQAGSRGDEVDAASDQYSLGIVLYELLCGEVPFAGRTEVIIYNILQQPTPNPSGFRPGIPRDLETICLKAAAKAKTNRYANCHELAEDLQRWLNDEPILAQRAGCFERSIRWCRREPLIATLAVLLVATLAISVGLLAFLTDRGQGSKSPTPPTVPPGTSPTVPPGAPPTVPPPIPPTVPPGTTPTGTVPAPPSPPPKTPADDNKTHEPELDQDTYWSKISTAYLAFELKEYEKCDQLLNECAGFAHQWEWAYLTNALQTAVKVDSSSQTPLRTEFSPGFQVSAGAFHDPTSTIVIAGRQARKLRVDTIDPEKIHERMPVDLGQYQSRVLAAPAKKIERRKWEVAVGSHGKLLVAVFQDEKKGSLINTVINLDDHLHTSNGNDISTESNILLIGDGARTLVLSNDVHPVESKNGRSSAVRIDIVQMNAEGKPAYLFHELLQRMKATPEGILLLTSNPLSISEDGTQILFPDCIQNLEMNTKLIDGLNVRAPVAFGPSGKQIAAIMGQGIAVILHLDFETRTASSRIALSTDELDIRDRVTNFEFLPDDSRVFTVSVDGTVRIWQVDRVARPISLPGKLRDLKSLDVSRDGRYLVCINNEELMLYDAGQGYSRAQQRESDAKRLDLPQ